MPNQLTSTLWTSLLLVGCSAKGGPGPSGPLPALVVQRVTATVQREALQLVRLATEHGTLLTTPEHPFATPGSGWIGAGRLRPDHWVVSDRFGAVRLLSVRTEPAARPVPVFNLSVASSHAYFVGTDRVLVHNTRCKRGAESREETIQRLLREREEIVRELNALTKTTRTSPRIVELKAQRRKLSMRINTLRAAERSVLKVPGTSKAEQSRRFHEADRDAMQEELDKARTELAALESQSPTSEAEKLRLAAQEEALKKRIAALTLSTERSTRILTLLRELEELDQQTPTTEGDRQALEHRKEELRAELDRERKRQRALKDMRNRRAAPERQEEGSYDGAQRHRLLRQLTLLQDELARQNQEVPSESRDARIHHLTEQISTIERLVQIRRESETVRQRRWRLRNARGALAEAGENSRNLDQQLAQAERELLRLRIERVQVRVRAQLLAHLDKTPWPDAPQPVDEAQLREFERQLAAGLTNEQLHDIEQALDAADPVDRLAEITDPRDAVLDEARDVSEVLDERRELMERPPSPERTAAFQSSGERLRQELREERAAVEATLSALVNDYAHVQTTQAASSTGPSWQDRLRTIQQEQAELLAQWHARLQARLDSTRRQLQILRSMPFRDDAIEADVVQELALLERELQASRR